MINNKAMTVIHVVGIGLEGSRGLTPAVRQRVEAATLLVGSDRHLSYFPDHPAPRLVLNDFNRVFQQLQHYLDSATPPQIVILTSGDPLFFGLGRLLLLAFPPEQLCFHPHLSAVQLGFSRIKVPWQDARLISAHGRSLSELTTALQSGAEKIAILTDPRHSPAAIAQLILGLNLPIPYDCWVCENLGGEAERVQKFSAQELLNAQFAPLNLVILLRTAVITELDRSKLPLFGLPDTCFYSFPDRPGLITKRELRMLVLGELSLQPGQVIWDIGAGTGAVAIEIARLLPQSSIFAIEKTGLGQSLITKNCERLQVPNVSLVPGAAPQVLTALPDPDRIFIGGSGGQLQEILTICRDRLRPGGLVVLSLATLEHLALTLNCYRDWGWSTQVLQAQLSRAVEIRTSEQSNDSALTRFVPLNPVALVKAMTP
uniref:Precorrin-6y C5,15-methyltransferase (Decarboxylating), CbiE subunit n=1 Tax=Cyanothece sp. (strain PCC 7425 / ATCC 29141) TaxID=395961 RepID=B8HMP8_CYAP4